MRCVVSSSQCRMEYNYLNIPLNQRGGGGFKVVGNNDETRSRDPLPQTVKQFYPPSRGHWSSVDLGFMIEIALTASR
jgi:hypothetical protein